MSIDDLARSAAQDARATAAGTFDVDGGLARIPVRSRRRTLAQQASSLMLLALLLVVGLVSVRPHPGALPGPATSTSPTSTPKPAPTPVHQTGASTALAAEPPIIRGDPARHRAFILIRLNNASSRAVYPGETWGHVVGGQLGGEVIDAAFADVVARGTFATIDRISNAGPHRPAVLAPGGTYGWFLELDTDCRAPITPDASWYWNSTSPFGMGVSYVPWTDPGAEFTDGVHADAFPTPNVKDPSVLVPPYPGWTLPSWVAEARDAVCGGRPTSPPSPAAG